MWAEIPFWFQVGVIFMLGISIGSFLNVCIYRLPREESIVFPGSRCPHCRRAISWYHNFPLISYLILRGRCHFCQDKISPIYFMVELLTGAFFVALYFYSRPFPDPLFIFIIYAFLLSGLIIATFVDLEFYIIPDSVSLGGIPLGIISCSFFPYLMNQSTPLWGGLISLFSGLFGASILLIISFLGKKFFKKEAMGMGDVKLMAMIGTFLGIPNVCLTLFAGSILGSILGLLLIWRGTAGLKSQIPFGPYLAGGAVISLFFGNAIWDWYLGF